MKGDRLPELIEQATVDAYNESEQTTRLFLMIEENLAVPSTWKQLRVLCQAVTA